MRPVLVDTSIFVDFLRGVHPQNQEFRKLIEAKLVVLSPFVRLELLAGVKTPERKILSNLLDSFGQINTDEMLFKTAESLIPLYKRQGLNVGLVDYLITLQALSLNFKLYTRDKQMMRLARILEVEIHEG